MTIEPLPSCPTPSSGTPRKNIPEKIKTICCECGILVHDGPLQNGRVSHGYCERCHDIIINGEKINVLSQTKTIFD